MTIKQTLKDWYADYGDLFVPWLINTGLVIGVVVAITGFVTVNPDCHWHITMWNPGNTYHNLIKSKC